MRIAAVHIPFFAIVAHRRRDRDVRNRPLLLVDATGRGGKPVVVARSPEAVRLGVLPGAPAASAAAGCPDAILRPIDLPYCRAEHERVRAALFDAIPEIEDESLGSWCFPTAGLERLLGPDATLAADVRRRVHAAGYASRVAVASARFVALAVARFGTANERVVAPGAEAAAIARFPLRALPIEADTLRSLSVLGARTLGEFARLPEAGVRSRFGDAGARAHALARGIDAAPPIARPEVPDAEVAHEFDPPTEALDEALFHLRMLCDRLTVELERRGLACAEVLAELHLDGAEAVEIAARPTRPTLSARMLWTLLRLQMERVTLDGPLVVARLAATGTATARAVQRDLFHSRRDSDRLEAAIARLIARFGKDAATTPVALDTHRPEARVAWRPYRVEEPNTRRGPGDDEMASLRVCRLLAEPRPISMPAQRIAAMSHAERLDGDWWETEFSREYRIARFEDGRVALLYRDLLLDEWFLQGEFD